MFMLYHEIIGTGEPVVLIHGYGETSEVWHQLASDLEKEYQFLIVDLPGFGKSAVQESLSMTSMVDDIKEIMDSISWNKAVLLGHSMGGYVSLEFAHLYPEMLCGLGLLHSTANADTVAKTEGRRKVIEFLEDASLEGYAKLFAPNLFAVENREKKEWVDAAHELVLKGSNKGLQMATEAMIHRKDRNHVFDDLDIPYLFVTGRHDELVPMDDMLKQASYCRRSVTGLFDHSGHLSMVENPDKLKKVVSDYLSWVFR